MFYFGFWITDQIIFLPILIILMMITASGMGMWLTAMAIQYRDINYGLGFFIQLLMYLAPVVYPLSNVPESFRLIYSLFPMVGVIEGFRSILLQTNPIPWDIILFGGIVAITIFISGAFYFRRMEKYFADVA